MNINEQALMNLAERTNAPGYMIDPFLAASALPQNARPDIHVVASDEGIARAQARAKEEGDTARARGYVDGSINGIPSAQLVAAGSSSSNVSTFLSEVSKQIESLIPLMGNKDAFLPALAQVEASVSAKHSDFLKEASAQAYTKHNVLAFEKAVQDNITMDNNSPGYRAKYGTTDSDETIAARQHLQSATRNAEGSIPELLNGNPAYRSFDAYSKSRIDSIRGLFNDQMKKQGDIDWKAEVEMSGYMPEQRAALATISEFTDPVAQWKFLNAQGNKKNLLLEAISSTPEQLAVRSMEGNTFAQILVKAKEIKILSEKEVDKRLGIIAGIVADSVTAQKAYEKLKLEGGIPTAKLAELDKKASEALMSAQDPKKNSQELALAFRKDLARQFASHGAQRSFDEDMLALRGKSQFPLPKFLEEAAKDPKTGTISKEKALILAKQASSANEKQDNINTLVEYYSSAAKTQDGSIFFKLQPMAAEQIKVEAALSEIFPRIGALVGTRKPLSNEERQRLATQSFFLGRGL